MHSKRPILPNRLGFAGLDRVVVMKNQHTTSLDNSTASQGLLSRKQVANLFSVCKETIRRWERQGMLTPLIINSRVLRYHAAEINALMGRN